MLMLPRFLLGWKGKPPVMVQGAVWLQRGAVNSLRALFLMGHEHRRPALLSQGLPRVGWRYCGYVILSTAFCSHPRLGAAERGCPLAPLAQVQASGIPGS